MSDSLEKNQQGQTRTLYSLRHTFATFELLNNKTDIHTLSKQMGNSAAMIKRHYSKLTATMVAERLALGVVLNDTASEGSLTETPVVEGHQALYKELSQMNHRLC